MYISSLTYHDGVRDIQLKVRRSTANWAVNALLKDLHDVFFGDDNDFGHDNSEFSTVHEFRKACQKGPSMENFSPTSVMMWQALQRAEKSIVTIPDPVRKSCFIHSFIASHINAKETSTNRTP